MLFRSAYDSLGNAFTWCDNVVVPVILGVNENNVSKVSLFPNPAKDNITINNLKGNEVIRLTTIEGKVIHEVVNSDAEKITIDLNDFTNGIYLVSVTGSNTRYKEKVVINK